MAASIKWVGLDVHVRQTRLVLFEQATGELALLGRRPTHGWSPCHVSVDATGRCAVVANYHGEGGPGSVAVFGIERDGTLKASQELGVTIIAYSPLRKGVLGGKYTPAHPPAGPRGAMYNASYLRRVEP
jgi:hypothetical protein